METCRHRLNLLIALYREYLSKELTAHLKTSPFVAKSRFMKLDNALEVAKTYKR